MNDSLATTKGAANNMVFELVQDDGTTTSGGSGTDDGTDEDGGGQSGTPL